MSDIESLRALLAAATERPWVVGMGAYVEFEWGGDVSTLIADAYGHTENAELIAAAINALPSLLDRLEAAETERDALAQRLDVWTQQAEGPIKAHIADLNKRLDHQRDKFCWHDPEGQHAAMQARAESAEAKVARVEALVHPVAAADWAKVVRRALNGPEGQS